MKCQQSNKSKDDSFLDSKFSVTGAAKISFDTESFDQNNKKLNLLFDADIHS